MAAAKRSTHSGVWLRETATRRRPAEASVPRRSTTPLSAAGPSRPQSSAPGAQTPQSIRSWEGRATAPSTGWPSIARATWTARSGRPWAYSFVPSRGSTIHARDLEVRSGALLVSSESSPSSG